MLQLALAVQKIELVGGESWLEHDSVALAAITAAALAALVAVLNRRAELRHDREMRNRDHIREVVDQSYVEVTQAMKYASEYSGVIRGTEEWRAKVEDAAEEEALLKLANSELDEGREKSHTASMSLLTVTARLQMRLGLDHPITIAHEEVQSAIRDLHEHLPASIGQNRDPETKQVDDKLADAIGAAYRNFRDACFRWINN